MGNIFDDNIYNDFISNKQYNEAADYLESCDFTPEERLSAYNKVDSLRREAGIENAILEKMTPYAQQAYHFITAIDGGSNIPHQQYNEDGSIVQDTANYFGDKYTDLINNLKIKDPEGNTHRVTTMIYSFNDEKGFKSFLGNIGSVDKEEAISKYGIDVKRNNNTGKIEVYVPTTSKQFVDLDKAAMTHKIYLSPFGYYNRKRSDIPEGYLTSEEAMYSVNVITDNGKRYKSNSQDISQDNIFLSLRGNIFKAKDIVDEARNLQQKELDANSTVTTIEDIYTTEFLGFGHMKAYEDMNKQIITPEQYDRIVKHRTNAYDNAIMAIEPNNYEVYAYNDDRTLLIKVTDPKEKNKIKDDIQLALNDKRLTYRLGMLGGEYGTSFDVVDKPTSKLGIVEKQGKNRRYFFPGFLKESCEQFFSKDTKTIAIRQSADLKRWNYGRNLHDGTFIGHKKDQGFYTIKTDDLGVNYEIPISEEDALRQLNKEAIITNGVRTVLSKLNDDYSPQRELKDGEVISIDIENRIKTVINAGINELYPAEQYSFDKRFLEANNLYQTILRLTKYKANQQEYTN